MKDICLYSQWFSRPVPDGLRMERGASTVLLAKLLLFIIGLST
jgi:hypothetical protein